MTRTSFLDSRFRLRNRVNRLIAQGLPATDRQLDPVAHVGRPGLSTVPREREAPAAA